jgi:hypothetical protein
MTILQSVNLFVNSAQRLTGNSNSFSLLLNPPLQLKGNNSVWEVKVATANIPYSFNTVNASNNKLFGFINNQLWSITVPAGNYNILNLISTIRPLIISACSALGHAINLNWTYTKTIAKTTMVYTGLVPFVIDYNSSSVLMTMLGFKSNISLTNGQSITSSQCVNVNPVQSLYVRSDTLNQSFENREALLTKGEVTDILAEIPVQTAPLTFINFANAQGQSARIKNQIIDRVQLYLSDTNNFELDLGGLDWTCSLVFDEVTVDFVNQSQANLKQLSELSASDTAKAKLDDLEQQRQATIKDLETEREKMIKSLQK